MESAEHLARVLSLQSRGVHVLLWEDKSDLVRALLVLRASFSSFPESLILLPTADADLQKFSIQLFEDQGLACWTPAYLNEPSMEHSYLTWISSGKPTEDGW
ncbi:MAG: hypothetical protein EA424_13505 [Planctomycetaceae bacterium]|nr:MAG: hypothetical protein EA424_13505 [Planctomycetaceae bacterium]